MSHAAATTGPPAPLHASANALSASAKTKPPWQMPWPFSIQSATVIRTRARPSASSSSSIPRRRLASSAAHISSAFAATGGSYEPAGNRVWVSTGAAKRVQRDAVRPRAGRPPRALGCPRAGRRGRLEPPLERHLRLVDGRLDHAERVALARERRHRRNTRRTRHGLRLAHELLDRRRRGDDEH